jgi:uncharacterized protein (TIGR04255 family)
MNCLQLSRSPLVLVVAQVQFSPVERIKEEYIPKIQEQLRTSGFPYFEMRPIQQVTMDGLRLQLLTQEQWFFYLQK